MTVQPEICREDRVRAFVEGTLPAAERSAFEAHLDRCDACRQALDRAVASPDQWDELRTSLSANSEFLPPRGSDVPDQAAPQLVGSFMRLLGPTDDPRSIGRIGHYEIVGVLGQGGMGVVFKGLDPSLNRSVAIKMLAPFIAASAASRQRFLREAQSAAAVMHEHVVAIHGISDWQGAPFLVMEYVRGESLQKRLATRGLLPIRELLRIGMQVASGLAAAHSQGLIHRDIKPANILLETGVDRARITDFGLARAVDDIRLTRTDLLVGTPQYMSPEQARDEALDFRTDLFSLGVVLYEAATGREPFQAATSYGTLRKIVDHHPPPVRQLNPDLPEWFERIVSKLIAKDPRQRYSAGELAVLLKQCLAHVEQPHLIELPAPLQEKRQGIFVTWRTAMSATALVLMLSGGWWLVAQMGGGDVPAPSTGEVASQAAAAADAPKEAEPKLPSVTVDKYTISVRKVADVSDMKMEMEFDISKATFRQQGQGFSGQGGGAFAGAAAGGGGGSFEKPRLGVALAVTPATGPDQVLVEVSPQATAIDDVGSELKTANTGPGTIHFRAFERSAPGCQPIYFDRPNQGARSLKRLDGELLLTPGRVTVASFDGIKFNAPRSDGAEEDGFKLQAINVRGDGIEILASFPPTKDQVAAKTPQERFAASIGARGAYAAEIEDDAGEVHFARGSSTAMGVGGQQFGFGGQAAGGRAGGKQLPNAGSGRTFHFSALSDGRQVKTVRLRMTERTGPTKAIPFTIENVPIGAAR